MAEQKSVDGIQEVAIDSWKDFFNLTEKIFASIINHDSKNFLVSEARIFAKRVLSIVGCKN